MRSEAGGKAELARRLGWHLPQVDRVLDVRHKSRMDHIVESLLDTIQTIAFHAILQLPDP